MGFPDEKKIKSAKVKRLVTDRMMPVVGQAVIVANMSAGIGTSPTVGTAMVCGSAVCLEHELTREEFLELCAFCWDTTVADTEHEKGRVS